MPKFSREELSGRINDLDIDEEVKMSLIEDVSDSIVDDHECEDKYNEKQKEYDDLYSKYKERFFASDKKEDNMDEFRENNEEVIDIREIF